MRITCLAAILVFLVAGTAGASTVDFRNASTFGGALNQASFSAIVDGTTITASALPAGARLWWDSTDGFGVQYSYESDEIESLERLRISFSAPVNISRLLITDLFNESGYLEQGAYQLNGAGSWISFTADPSQVPGSTNGQLLLPVDSSIPVSSILFRAPGRLTYPNQAHEFSVAAIETTAVPIPAAFWLLGSGLVGLAALRRKRTK